MTVDHWNNLKCTGEGLLQQNTDTLERLVMGNPLYEFPPSKRRGGGGGGFHN